MSDIKTMDFTDMVSGFRTNPVQFANDAKEKGYTLSRYLDMISPPSGERAEDKAPTFNRLLREEDMAFISDPQAGFYASRMSDFMTKDYHRMLFAELCYNRARRVWYGSLQNRGIVLSDDAVQGSILRPFVDRLEAVLDETIRPAVPLSEILAFTNFISSRFYRALYFERDSEETQAVQIAEGTNIPTGILKHQMHTIDLPKRGRGISITDEVMRDNDVRIDRVLFQIELIALESEVDRVDDAVQVLLNGDGNPVTVPVTYHRHNLIHGETTGVDFTRAWLAYTGKFQSPYMLTRVLADESAILNLKTLDLGTRNHLMLNLAGSHPGIFPSFRPMNDDLVESPRIGIVNEVTAKHYVGFDHRLALERVVEIGSEVQEMARYARNQTNFLGITENSNFAIFQPETVIILKDATS